MLAFASFGSGGSMIVNSSVIMWWEQMTSTMQSRKLVRRKSKKSLFFGWALHLRTLYFHWKHNVWWLEWPSISHFLVNMLSCEDNGVDFPGLFVPIMPHKMKLPCQTCWISKSWSCCPSCLNCFSANHGWTNWSIAWDDCSMIFSLLHI